ncbi:MAG: Xaa-Pro peptidase family protein [Anaerolineales bacterium]|nr:Xaa-Pro peptidase family protein [Anaerolineales bacterium]
MKTDIDRLMKEADLDALLVLAPATHNAPMIYFTGLTHLTTGFLLKMSGEKAILFHKPMEREEAAATGLVTKDIHADYDFPALLEQANSDRNQAESLLIEKVISEYKIHGRIGISGKIEFGHWLRTIDLLRRRLPDVEILGEDMLRSVITQARVTKDDSEIERIRAMGRITTAVVGDVAGFLTSHGVNNGYLVNREGKKLTIGDVKRKINLWLAMRGAENPEGSIFAVGREAGIPHSTGTDSDPIPVGQTIVFDIYPCEAGGGYFYDFTRTWCLGYAPDEALQVYEDVLEVYETVYSAIRPNKPCRDYQILTCELFEAKGHPSTLSNPMTTDGYVHNLAHGIGLDVHEAPSFYTKFDDVLLPGSVITVEPGLYYPDRGLGVRIEDTAWMRPDGVLETLVEYPKDLVLKMPGV